MQTAVLSDGVLLRDKREASLPKIDGEVPQIVGKVCDNKQKHTFDVSCVSRTRQEQHPKDMERERKNSGLLLDQLIKRLVQHDLLHCRVPLKRFALSAREEKGRCSELGHIGRRRVVHYNLPLRKPGVNSETIQKIPALDSLFEAFGYGAVAINADNTELNVFAAAQVQQGVEQSLLGLVAERREMVQNNQQRNAANLGFLQNLEVNHNICLHDLKKLHVFELSVFESLI